MTIGPDPITSTDFRSSRLGTADPFEEGAEVVEVVGGVVRAWSGFRVVLHAEHRALEQPQALHHAVVEVDVADHGGAVGGAERLPRPRRHVHPGGRAGRFRGNVRFLRLVRYLRFTWFPG